MADHEQSSGIMPWLIPTAVPLLIAVVTSLTTVVWWGSSLSERGTRFRRDITELENQHKKTEDKIASHTADLKSIHAFIANAGERFNRLGQRMDTLSKEILEFLRLLIEIAKMSFEVQKSAKFENPVDKDSRIKDASTCQPMHQSICLRRTIKFC